MPQDLNAIECQGLPPQVLLIPVRTAQGNGLEPQLTRPNLPRRSPCCALFAAKTAALPGLAVGGESMAVAERPAPEPKQGLIRG